MLEGHDNFKDFMRFKFDPARPYQYHIDTSLQLQSDYLVDLHGNVLVNKVGKYENLQGDFDNICEHIGLKKIKLPHKRKADDRKRYRAYYDDDLAEKVANHFARDIQMLGYEF